MIRWIDRMRVKWISSSTGCIALFLLGCLNGAFAQGWVPPTEDRWFGEEVKTWSLRQEHALAGLLLQATGPRSEIKGLAQCLHAVAHRRPEADRLCEDFMLNKDRKSVV